MFEDSKLESLLDVSVIRIGDALSYGFPQTELRPLVLKATPFSVLSLKLIFEPSKWESQCDVSVTGNDDAFSYGFPQTE